MDTQFLNRFGNYFLTNGINLNTIGGKLAWVNGYQTTYNNPFPNNHSMIISEGGATEVNNQLIINTTGEMLFRHSDDGKNFGAWTQCGTTVSVNAISLSGHCSCKSGKLVNISCPSMVFQLSNGCLLTTLPAGYRPPYLMQTPTTAITNGVHKEVGYVSISPDDGGIRYYGSAAGAHELCYHFTYIATK